MDLWIPELNKQQRERIKDTKTLVQSGCHATGFIMALYPLIAEQVVPLDYPVFTQSLTGYSGGGKKLIAVYESGEIPEANLRGPALCFKPHHKHLAEMQKVTGLQYPPFFTPIVGPFYQGMMVSIPLISRMMPKKITAGRFGRFWPKYYQSEPFVRVLPFESGPFLDNGFLSPA